MALFELLLFDSLDLIGGKISFIAHMMTLILNFEEKKYDYDLVGK